jgi:hypothetical protein
MNKNIIAAAVLLGMSISTAQANLTINATHDSAPNQIETYFFQATTGGASNIFLSSVETVAVMDTVLSVWQQSGANWSLVGANDNAAFSSTTGINNFGVAVHQWVSTDPLAGLSDPGLTLNLTSGANYLVINSNYGSGPTSLTFNGNGAAVGSMGQTIAIGSSLLAALKPDTLGYPAGLLVNPYTLTVTGNVLQTSGPAPAAVPLPAAIWLFGSTLAGFGLFGRKKTVNQLVS